MIRCSGLGLVLLVTPAIGQPLSLDAAIRRAVEQAPAPQAAAAAAEVTEAEARGVRGALQPQLGVSASQFRATSNLAAQGLTLPGIEPLIGPFSSFDARVALSQVIFDWSRVLQSRGARLAVDVARAQARQAREQAAASAAIAYVAVLGGQQALAAAQANLELSQDLLNLAQDRRDAGVASGVDVARAETALSQARFALSSARAQLESAHLRLARVLALPPSAVQTLDGVLRHQPASLLTADAALARARSQRADLAVVAAQLRQLDQALELARSARLPKLTAFADYGLSGSTPVQNEEDTYRYGASLSVPIFTGGTISAEIDAARGRLLQARWQAKDLEAQVEQDVRTALVEVANRSEQVDTADATRTLAERELQLARDRFGQGVADNIEVVQAQTSLTEARADYVQALAAFQQARINLAAALGQAQDFRLQTAAKTDTGK